MLERGERRGREEAGERQRWSAAPPKGASTAEPLHVTPPRDSVAERDSRVKLLAGHSLELHGYCWVYSRPLLLRASRTPSLRRVERPVSLSLSLLPLLLVHSLVALSLYSTTGAAMLAYRQPPPEDYRPTTSYRPTASSSTRPPLAASSSSRPLKQSTTASSSSASSSRTTATQSTRLHAVPQPAAAAPPPLAAEQPAPAKAKSDKGKLTEQWGAPPTLIRRDRDVLQRGELLGEVSNVAIRLSLPAPERERSLNPS